MLSSMLPSVRGCFFQVPLDRSAGASNQAAGRTMSARPSPLTSPTPPPNGISSSQTGCISNFRSPWAPVTSSYQTVCLVCGSNSSDLPSPLMSQTSPHSKLPFSSISVSGHSPPSAPGLRNQWDRFSCQETEIMSNSPSPSTSIGSFMKSYRYPLPFSSIAPWMVRILTAFHLGAR